jgi:hypothetical protein
MVIPKAKKPKRELLGLVRMDTLIIVMGMYSQCETNNPMSIGSSGLQIDDALIDNPPGQPDHALTSRLSSAV